VASRALDGKCGLLGEVKWSEEPVRPVELRRVAGERRRKGVPPALSEASEIVYCLFGFFFAARWEFGQSLKGVHAAIEELATAKTGHPETLS
jgi:hypothetical protein